MKRGLWLGERLNPKKRREPKKLNACDSAGRSDTERSSAPQQTRRHQRGDVPPDQAGPFRRFEEPAIDRGSALGARGRDVRRACYRR